MLKVLQKTLQGTGRAFVSLEEKFVFEDFCHERDDRACKETQKTPNENYIFLWQILIA